MSKSIFTTALCVLMLIFLVSSVHAGKVSVEEAVQIADLWMAMDANGWWTGMTPDQRTAELARLSGPQVRYLTSKDALEEKQPAGRVLAYVLKYGDSGWVVVSADDRLEPVVAFDRTSKFRWDEPERNFARHFLGNTMANRWRLLDEGKLPDAIHPNWNHLRGKLEATETREAASFEPLAGYILRWTTALWDQGQFYNDEVVAHNGGDTTIPTGCTATAMAIQMRFHEWPEWGYAAYSYDDAWGSVQFSHSVNYSASNYLWDNMPVSTITSTNAEVAEIMYESGVAVEMDYESGGSAAWPWPSQMNTHFRFRGTTRKDTDYATAVQNSVKAALPTIVSSTSHTVLVCGYRETMSPYNYINAGWGGSSNGWYNFPDMPAGTDTTIDRTYPYSSPNNYTYVGPTSAGAPNGNMQSPWPTVSQGKDNTPSDGHLWLQAGTYAGAGNVPVLFDTPISIRACYDAATIGDNIRIYPEQGEGLFRSDFPCIRVMNGGKLEIF